MADANTFRCTGRDRYLGHERVWFVRAPDAAAARAHAESKGLVEPVVASIDEAQVPEGATVLLVHPAGERGAAGRPPRVLQRVLLVLVGVALGLFAVGGYVFVNKAREHLLRDRGRTPPGVAAPTR